MKTEQEIRESIGKEIFKSFPKTEAVKKVNSLDTTLEVMSQCIELGIDCPIAWAEVEKVVQEPDDFWIWCMGEAWKMTGEPARVNICSTLLMKELGIKIGREALLKAHQDGR